MSASRQPYEGGHPQHDRGDGETFTSDDQIPCPQGAREGCEECKSSKRPADPGLVERVQDCKSKADPGSSVENHLQENRDRRVADRTEQDRRWNPWIQEEEYVSTQVPHGVPGGDGL